MTTAKSNSKKATANEAGETFRSEVASLLSDHGYTVITENRVEVENGIYKIDITASREGEKTIDIEAKSQESRGSIFEKIPFGCARLWKVAKSRKTHPVLIYGGSKMTQAMYTNTILKEELSKYPGITVMYIGDVHMKLKKQGSLI